jgi:hypothetical protein
MQADILDRGPGDSLEIEGASSLLKKPSMAFSTSPFERRSRASVSIAGEFSSLENSARNNTLRGI